MRNAETWSDLLRSSRNALHWDNAPEIPNDYQKAGVLLLGAAEHLRDLQVVMTAAKAVGGHAKL